MQQPLLRQTPPSLLNQPPIPQLNQPQSLLLNQPLMHLPAVSLLVEDSFRTVGPQHCLLRSPSVPLVLPVRSTFHVAAVTLNQRIVVEFRLSSDLVG
jgi:hypothetical protein